ncbi:tRNA lysidine(34) synthetase TilS [Gordonia polyisoprenivorans]|uniref:tRNA lysidine(34) synthetase TilS n=1 Tax=Gordonia polyisoprenivorans TaxID=84595 RepID=UPI001AD7BB6C|nr:tRNA lysidine(34) synthetase TilS [Gordonia polyisoprenivorans]QTI68824.1 tRNA lysidine(34) synthetase TilS [Gordonia polyisoprenivorans]
MDSAGALTRAVERFAADHLDGHRQVCVGLSGGPDSLALTAAAVRAGFKVRALVVDHRLQRGSAHVADAAAEAARGLGARAQVIEVSVGTAGGMEAAARAARYDALEEARDGCPVLLGHTADDQAETVLLGLARGSGARSIAGMRAWSAPWGRPFLGIRRAQTVGACTELGLAPHADAHNRDPRFTRVRLRSEVLPLLDDVLHGGVVEALCRTADALRADTDALDALAEEHHRVARTAEGLAIAPVRDLATALRTRVIRRWLLDVGATEPTSRVIGAVDALVVDWHGQGGVAVGGDGGSRREVARVGDVLTVRDSPR